MVRVAGVDIPDRKRLEYALRGIYGIGPTRAQQVTERAVIEGNPRVSDLTEHQLTRIREIIDQDYVVEGDLRREIGDNIRRLVEIGSYRGIRHRRGLPLRGQRTKTNARTKRGSKRAVAGKRRVLKK
jgi:small subunit ribosomal protein S13